MGYTSLAMWPSKLPYKHNRLVNKDNSRGAVAGDLVGASNANPKVIGDSDEAAAKDAGKTQIARSRGRIIAHRGTERERERERVCVCVCERAREKEGCGVRWQWCRLWLLLHGLDLSSSRRRAEEWRRYLLQLFGGGGYKFRAYYRNNHSQECRVTRFLPSSANSRQPALPFLLLM